MNNLFEALKSRKPAPAPKKAEYRLYYDKETGDPLFYSMEEHENKDFIVIDRETFVKGKQGVHIKDGKLHAKVYSIVYKLVPSDEGTQCYKNDISIVDPNSDVYWGNKVESKIVK